MSSISCQLLGEYMAIIWRMSGQRNLLKDGYFNPPVSEKSIVEDYITKNTKN